MYCWYNRQRSCYVQGTSTRYSRVIMSSSSSSPTYSYPFSWASPSLYQNAIKYLCGLDSVVERVCPIAMYRPKYTNTCMCVVGLRSYTPGRGTVCIFPCLYITITSSVHRHQPSRHSPENKRNSAWNRRNRRNMYSTESDGRKRLYHNACTSKQAT